MPAVKREYTDSDSDSELDTKPSIAPSPKKSMASASPKKNTPSPKKSFSSGEKKMGSWSGEELQLLYSTMCPKKIGVNWNEVAGQIPGRDAKSCANKWMRMQGKIWQMLERMGQ
ncbi:hypothetical protein IAR55_006167 [Kwoniella newhampshirensis]|uniref:Myb-like domain-containing protein n=1 Tax=Kwoniella newhampshirensis TaxID=1651941 RepID=A0AAW0YJZ6_9TREE